MIRRFWYSCNVLQIPAEPCTNSRYQLYCNSESSLADGPDAKTVSLFSQFLLPRHASSFKKQLYVWNFATRLAKRQSHD
jgi:hypothetical protein